MILAISGVHRGTVAGLHYARALSEDVTAVYVSTDPEQTAAIEKKWGLWGAGVRLVMLNSPYRLLVEPLLDYIRQVSARRQPNEVITIVVPQFVPQKRWHNVLHAQTAMMLRLALMFEPGIVITSVPYQVGRGGGLAMYVIIVGCGRRRLGARHAPQPARARRDDHRPRRLVVLAPRPRLARAARSRRRRWPRACSSGRASARRSALASVTNSDAVNAVVAHVARTVYDVPSVVSRNYDPRWRAAARGDGPARW